MWLLGVFSAFALALAGVGTYRVAHYSVSKWTHEFGISMALGARIADIFGMVILQGLRLAIIGVGAGVTRASSRDSAAAWKRRAVALSLYGPLACFVVTPKSKPS